MVRKAEDPPWRILAVDGDPGAHAFYKGALVSPGGEGQASESAGAYGEDARTDTMFDVVVCASEHEAMPLARQARETGRPFAVAFVDAGQGGGLETRLRQTDPGLHIVMVANGVPPPEPDENAADPHRLVWVRKPFQALEARRFASTLAAKWRAESEIEQLRLSLEEQGRRLAQAEEECARLRAALAASQRLRDLGELAGGVAHDFNNLLTGILGHASAIKRNSAPGGGVWDAVGAIEHAVDRASELASHLLGFGRKAPGQDGPASVHAVIAEILHLMEASLGSGVRVETRLNADPDLVLADAGELAQVLLNLVVNARDAMPNGGCLTLETAAVDMIGEERLAPGRPRPGRYVQITVRDTGKGVPASLRQRIFDPFFTTKEPGKGTGMGLAVVDNIVRGQHGAVHLESEEGKGAAFTVSLPAWTGARAPAASGGEEQAPACPPGLCVLLVDDDDVVLDVGREMLEAMGCQVATAASGQEALEVFGRNRERVGLVLMDMMMPGMSGAECLGELKRIAPEVKVVFSSGNVSGDADVQELARKSAGFIQKPYRLEKLASVVRQALGDGAEP